MLDGYLGRPGAAQVGRPERGTTGRGESTVEVRHPITSVPRGEAGAAELLGWARGRRGIEDRLHYVRDATMGEGANRTGSGPGPQVLATPRDPAIAAPGRAGVTSIASALRRNAARVRDLPVSLRILKN
jgi:hypothetical protein